MVKIHRKNHVEKSKQSIYCSLALREVRVIVFFLHLSEIREADTINYEI